MYSASKIKLGLFGSNCSSGRFITTVPERWSGSWEDNARLAQMADEAGIDFLLPIARWKGWGGETDYQGHTWETITWATGLLAITKRITVFGTVHATLFPPLIAAKQMVTADHVSHGRFGLNLVCGWNEGEFEMFGVDMRGHDSRYRQGQEWLDVLRRIWTDDDFDWDGEFFQLKGVREKPKPYNDERPLIINAGASDDGRDFALRNCDAWFTTPRIKTLEGLTMFNASGVAQEAKAYTRARGREISVFTVGVIVCRPTRADAEDYWRYATDAADWTAVDNLLSMRRLSGTPEDIERRRREFPRGNGGLPIVGDPDYVAEYLAQISAAGFDGCAISMLNYADELPYFAQEVLPRLEARGLREPAR